MGVTYLGGYDDTIIFIISVSFFFLTSPCPGLLLRLSVVHFQVFSTHLVSENCDFWLSRSLISTH